MVQAFGWDQAFPEVFFFFDPLGLFKEGIWHVQRQQHIASSTLIGVQWNIRNPDAVPGRIRHVDSPRIAKAFTKDVVRDAYRRSMKNAHECPPLFLPDHSSADRHRDYQILDCSGFGLPAKSCLWVTHARRISYQRCRRPGRRRRPTSITGVRSVGDSGQAVLWQPHER